MLCKTKQEYLHELSGELRGYFKKKDVENIISDYNEFFDTGIAEGKSEVEICENFGDIKELAREIAENQTDAKRKTYNKKYIIVGSLAVIIVFLFVILNESLTVMLNTSYKYSFFYDLSKLGIFFVPLLILLLIKLYKKYEININEKILFIFACIPALIILFMQFILFNHASDEPRRIMLDVTNFLNSIKIISILIIAAVVILNLRKENPDYINIASIVFILTGIYQTFNDILFLFSVIGIYAPIDFILKLLNSFMPLCLGLIFAALLYLFSFWRKYLPKFKKQEARDK